jgi:hypothetical protein
MPVMSVEKSTRGARGGSRRLTTRGSGGAGRRASLSSGEVMYGPALEAVLEFGDDLRAASEAAGKWMDKKAAN